MLLTPAIACIVEGHGEEEAVPVLIRRIGEQLGPPVYPQVARPIRKSKGLLVNRQDELENAVELAARKAGGDGGIFILIDSDDDCPKDLGQRLRDRAIKARGDLPIAVVLAKREYEAWFLAAAVSLRGKRGLATDLQPPQLPEDVQDAKGWLTRNMVSGKYVETLDQTPLTHEFDFAAAQSVRSFRKCYGDIAGLLTYLRDQGDATQR